MKKGKTYLSFREENRKKKKKKVESDTWREMSQN